MRKLPFFKFDADDWLTGKIQLLTPSEKGLYVDICARCWRENGRVKNDNFLHRSLRVDKATLSEALKAFFELDIICENNGFLSVKFLERQIDERQEFIEKQSFFGALGGRPKKGIKPKQKAECRKQIEENIIQEKNNITKEKRFTPPTIDEIKAYIAEKKYSVDAETFYNFYESKGWMIGKNKMKSWQSSIAYWERSNKTKGGGQNGRLGSSNSRQYLQDNLKGL